MKVYKVPTVNLVLFGILFAFILFYTILFFGGDLNALVEALPILVFPIVIFGALFVWVFRIPVKIIVDGSQIIFKSLVSSKSFNIADIVEIDNFPLSSHSIYLSWHKLSTVMRIIFSNGKTILPRYYSFADMNMLTQELKRMNSRIVEKKLYNSDA